MGNSAGIVCKCMEPFQSICEDKKQSFRISDWEDSSLAANSKNGVNHSPSNKMKKIKNKNTNNLDKNSIKNKANDELSNKNKKSSLFNSNSNLNNYVNTNSTFHMSKISNNTSGNFISGLKNKHNNIINGLNKNIKNKNEIQEIQEEIKYKIVNDENNTKEQIIKKNDENQLKSNPELIIPEGDKYEGEIKNKKPNGKGKYYAASGQIKEGNFKDGLLDGQGKITYPDGKEYSGEFSND